MASRNPEDLTPALQARLRLFDERMKAAGIPYRLTCTARTVKEQIALYAQGREALPKTNLLRKLAGLLPINLIENRKKVTWTLASKHIVDLDDGNPDNDKARAFDIAIEKKGQPSWDLKADVNENDIPDYEEAGRIGESIGLRWGGRFRKPDYVHFELP